MSNNAKITNKILQACFNNTLKGTYTDQVGLSQEVQGWFDIYKSINVIIKTRIKITRSYQQIK